MQTVHIGEKTGIKNASDLRFTKYTALFIRLHEHRLLIAYCFEFYYMRYLENKPYESYKRVFASFSFSMVKNHLLTLVKTQSSKFAILIG